MDDRRQRRRRGALRWLIGGPLCVLLFVVLWPHLTRVENGPPSSSRPTTKTHPMAATRPQRSGLRRSHHATAGTEPSATAAARDTACSQDRRAQLPALRAGIDPSASPDAAATHALLTRLITLEQPASVELQRAVEAAVARWPDDVEIAWLAYEHCDERSGCDRSAALARLTRADGDNLFAWLPDMAAARQAGDATRFARALRRAADAGLYDSRMGTSFLLLRPVLATLPVPPSCDDAPGWQARATRAARPADASLLADMEAGAIEHAIAMPGLQALSGCRLRELPASTAVVDDCRRLLAQFADGDTLLEQGMALPALIDLSGDNAARAAWRERYRRLRWLQASAPRAEAIEGFTWRMWAEGEVNVLRKEATSAGRWPPPDDWLPDDARGRALITGEPARD